MKKKNVRSKISRSKRPQVKRSHLKHYIQLYFISMAIFAITFISSAIILDSQPPCANTITCKQKLMENIDNHSVGYFMGHEVIPPKIDLASINNERAVLGVTAPDPNKHIYVDLSAQHLYAYDGTTEFMNTPIASGRWGKTPVGNFNIWSKFIATRMAGGSGADAYNLPNVPWTMYFYNDYALHGAYWHNNFGHTMSHGCVNMRIVDSKKLFGWADGPSGGQKGTAVSVCSHFTPPDQCAQDN